MRRINNILSLALITSITLFSCSDQQDPVAEDLSVPDDVVAQIAALGFDVDNFVPTKFESGYLVEGDIYLTDAALPPWVKELQYLPWSNTAPTT